MTSGTFGPAAGRLTCVYLGMDTVAGVFSSPAEARAAAGDLARAGFSADRINLLFPGSSEEQVHSIHTSDTEQPGVGAAIGGALGAALGLAGGFELGVGATALIPGVGPVLAFGIAGAALLGAGGLAAGAAAGKAADEKSTEEFPRTSFSFTKTRYGREDRW